MATDDDTPTTPPASPKKVPPRPQRAPQRPAPPRPAPKEEPTLDNEPDADEDDEGSRLDALKELALKVPKWGWALIVIVVVIVAFVLLRPPAEEEAGKDGEGNFTITYREQLTQSGTQAGCFVLMEGTRAIGISCIPAK